jgi:hypothetical protein
MKRVGLIAVALLLGVGCAEEEQEPTGITGLRIFEQTATEVSGTFAGAGASIDFTFRTESGKHVAIIRSADGRSLIDSTLANNLERTVYLNRATVFGGPLQLQPLITGDASAIDELSEMPEAELVQPLRDALAKRGVEKDLYAIAPSTETGHCVTWGWWAACTKRNTVSQVLR